MRYKLLLIFTLFSAGFLQAQNLMDLKINGATFTFSYNQHDGTAAIIDNDYKIDDREFPIYKQSRKIKQQRKTPGLVVVPQTVVINGAEYTVTTIGKAAFAGYSNIKSVVLPQTIKKIGDYAFFRSSIESIEIPASVKSVGRRAFGFCDNLKSITLPGPNVLLGDGLYDESEFCEVKYLQNPPKASRNYTAKIVATPKIVPGTADVDSNIPQSSSENNETFAIIIANEKYDTEAQAEYALNDGRIFREYCVKTLGIPDENIRLRENATLNNILTDLDWIEKVSSAYDGEARFLIYYAGHGIPDESTGEAYILPVDGIGTNIATGFSLSLLYQRLGSMNAKDITVFLDACFSGSQRGQGMLASARGVAVKTKASNPTGKVVVFSAAQGDETAHPYAEKGHGLFTYFLLKKLQETKGNVSYEDLGKYIKTQVRRRSIVVNDKSQTPTVSTSATMGNEWKKMKLK